ncbi:MAG TPA: cation-translocating P-type ATPase [Verrucomicrobiae bacterium]|nr:cation-translocating P-type ATPase [Verrucomicrobiae bacterium]
MPTEPLIPLNETQLKQPGPGPVTELEITGMTCGNCARHVAQAIEGVKGVEGAFVNLDAHHATVRWTAAAPQDTTALVQAVQQEGYGATIVEHAQPEHKHEHLAGWRLNIWLGVPITVFLVLGEWVFGLGLARWFQWMSFALSGVVQVFAGARFYRGAWTQLKAGNSNMDTLVALGSTTAFAYSAWALRSGQVVHIYFMEAAAIITLISVGHWVESRVSVRASSALRNLLDLAPAMARRRNSDGAETEVPVGALAQGDLIALRPGDRVPVDGLVLEGHSAVDESMLTGESAAVDKKPGAELYTGTVNLNGRLLMRVNATGEQTALAHIIAAVQRAQNSRANIQRLGDRVSSVFVPIVVLIALAAGLWWGLAPQSATLAHQWLAQFLWHAPLPVGPLAAGFISAAAVLIIACPCAMGLATPAAIMAGSNAAAQRGILIRDGVALEKAGQVTAVVFDKTGTLTLGKPALAQSWEPPVQESQPSANPAGLSGNSRAWAAALARHSTHPISRVLAEASSANMDLSDWQEIQGAGVQGRFVNSIDRAASAPLARLGSLAWLAESGVDLEPGRSFVQEWSSQGATIAGLALGGSLAGLFAVRDRLKPGAREVIERLDAEGFKTYLVTGDNALTASSIAQEAGIRPEHVFAQVRPERKGELVARLQKQGERVAFVGDGINDAPALEQADLGIAVSRASDIAREAADIILLKSEIEAVPESLGLARATLRTIKQNLFWAFFYNAVGIPLAALGFLSPILCAAAMGMSDLVVIGNALRLRGWRLRNR